MRPTIKGGTSRLVPHLLILAALSGCSGTAAPAPADEDQARTTLEQALSAWVEGRTVGDLKNASPAITVSDPRWARGDDLLAYEVRGDGKPSAAERVFHVQLKLKDGQGQELTESVDYRVGTNPVLTVFRSVF